MVVGSMVEGLECNDKSFEGDSLVYWEPVERVEDQAKVCFCVSEYPESAAWNILQSLNGFVGQNVFDGIAVFNVRKQDRHGPILDMSYKGQRWEQLDPKACDTRRKRDHVTIYGNIVIPALSDAEVQ